MNLDEIFGHVVGRFAQGVRPTDPITRVYSNVLRQFGEHALSRWSSVSAAGMTCAMAVEVHPITGQPGVCAALAAGSCVACQRSVCIMHAMVSPRDGGAICGACVAEARAAKGAPVEPPRARQEHDYNERLQRLGVLELSADATIADIKRAYKRLARENHPDTKRGRARERAERRLREINAAYAWLMDREGAYAA